MPSETIEPITSVSIQTPSVDFISFLEFLYHKLTDWIPLVFSGAQQTFGIIVAISFPVALFFLIGIIYCVEQIKTIRKKEEILYDTKTVPAYVEEAQGNPAMAHAWENVMRHIESPNQNDWKQAIMEADIMLDDILTSMGYQGESIGEKLKRASSGDFKSLDDAWEAHKVRNQIAHEPNFTLGHHEAKMTIGRFRKVFEEFYYV
jgi:hypothetical protein